MGQKVKRKTEADLCMEHVLRELFGAWWEEEFEFIIGRKFRFDFMAIVCPTIRDADVHGHKPQKLAIEIDGGAWTQGRHTRGAGFIRDLAKFNEAAILGWSILRFTPQQVLDGTAKEVIKRWLESHR